MLTVTIFSCLLWATLPQAADNSSNFCTANRPTTTIQQNCPVGTANQSTNGPLTSISNTPERCDEVFEIAERERHTATLSNGTNSAKSCACEISLSTVADWGGSMDYRGLCLSFERSDIFSITCSFWPNSKGDLVFPDAVSQFKSYQSGLRVSYACFTQERLQQELKSIHQLEERPSDIQLVIKHASEFPGGRKPKHLATWKASELNTVADCYNFIVTSARSLRDPETNKLPLYSYWGWNFAKTAMNCCTMSISLLEEMGYLTVSILPQLKKLWAITGEKTLGYLLLSNNTLHLNFSTFYEGEIEKKFGEISNPNIQEIREYLERKKNILKNKTNGSWNWPKITCEEQK